MKSVEHTLAFELQQPVSEVFPLFSPEGEKHWVPGWGYQNVMGTTELSEDYVFLTKFQPSCEGRRRERRSRDNRGDLASKEV